MNSTDVRPPAIDPDRDNLHLVINLLLAFVAVFTLFTNGLVITLLGKYQWLRSHTNCMIASLCVGGFIDGIVVISLISVQGIGQITSFTLLCQVISLSDAVIMTSTLLHLLAINIERYLAIKMPLKYSGLFIKRKTLINIFIVWGTSITGGVVLGQLYKFTADSGRCIPLPASQTNGILFSVFFFWLPFTLTCTAYGNICVIIRRRNRFMAANVRGRYQTHDGIYRIMFGVLGSSFIAFGPMAAVPLFIHQIDASRQETFVLYIVPLCRVMTHTGIAVNPLVYALCGYNFRKAMKMLLCGKCVNAGAPTCYPNTVSHHISLRTVRC